jgi:CDGSH-type Zn-finger protein
MPHRDAAWALLAERLDEAAWLCGQLQAGRGQHIAPQLEPVLAAMRATSRTLTAHLPAGSAHARLAAATARLEPAELDDLLARARELAAAAACAGGETADELAELFETTRAIVVSAAAGLDCGPGDQALVVPRLVDSVLRPLTEALSTIPAFPRTPHAGTPPGEAPTTPAASSLSQPGTTAGAEPTGRPGTTAVERVWLAAQAATALRTSMGLAGGCPPGLAEATAALQDLAGRLVPPSAAASQLDQLWELQSGLPAVVQASRNGPYLVTNVPRLLDHLGAESRPAPQLALCRCGSSAIKPLCDGACARTGFTDAKDPKRVPDRRDTYDGQQLTIIDNRGSCQHSGFCSDRLAAVFRTSTDPFVAPSGGRMDEITRAVRDCPSGALSYAIDGAEARDQVDWGGTRPPAIEVTRDGPYRVTGRISLLGADGSPEERGQGASLEHYALCRCGHSQNKPFCSGMHWYTGFRDPAPAAGEEPTLFEWAGGLPALARMSRFLYEKHVPADPMLAALFADMPPDQPQRLAAWLAGAIGGPADHAQNADVRQATGFISLGFGEEQRARWVTLAGTAADQAGLPADPGFRSAFSACVDWLARTAFAQSQPGAPQPPPAPHWRWGPGGPPETGPAPQAHKTDGPERPLPGPGQPVSFALHIKSLFRQRDQQSMSFALDLWSYDDVRAHAADILGRLQEGSMPCDGAWPADKIEVFKHWTDTGMQP